MIARIIFNFALLSLLAEHSQTSGYLTALQQRLFIIATVKGIVALSRWERLSFSDLNNWDEVAVSPMVALGLRLFA